MSGLPDPKPPKRRGNSPRRVVDPEAMRRCVLRWRACSACGQPSANAHHIIGKGQLGDDVDANLAALCGSGSTGCHGALHGTPYVVTVRPDPRSTTQFAPFPQRRDAEWVSSRIGDHISRSRRDTIAYVLDKLGDVAGVDYLERTYYLEAAAVA